jgi:sortase A
VGNKKNDFLPIKKILRVASPVLIILGLCLILVTAYPFLSYQLLVYTKNQERLVTPVSELDVAEAKGLVNPIPQKSAVAGVSTERKTVETEEIDYSQLNSWFPAAPLPKVRNSKITHYTLSIPELGIEDASVEVGGTKIRDSLIHYPGTALPGEYGNTVVFGHSVLPIFYNPKDYKAIFSKIPTLDKGEKIYLNYDGMRFVYQVEQYFEVEPEEVDVLQQRFNEQVLSLITCVPPGTYRKRGIIKARLVN